MRAIKILTVCGAGTVGAALLSSKLREMLTKPGYTARMTESTPSKIQKEDHLDQYDLVVYISPVETKAQIPMLYGIGFLLGINGEEFLEKFMNVIGALDLYED